MDDNQVQGKSIEERLSEYHSPESTPAVPDTQPSPTPSENQNTAEVESNPEEQEVAPQEKQEDQEEVEALQGSKNPERTKAYIEKLKNELKEARQKPTLSEPQVESQPETQDTSVFDTIRQATQQPETQNPNPFIQGQNSFLNPLQVENLKQQYVDQEGNVDIDGFNQAIRQAEDYGRLAYFETQKIAEQSRNTADRMAKYEENQQTREAHEVFPQLDPTNKKTFDKVFFNAVAEKLMLKNHVLKQGISYKQAAQEVAQIYKPKTVDTAKVEAEAVARYKETQQARNQGPMESGNGSPRRSSSIDELRERTRHGDDDALSERLKAIGI